MCNTLSSGFQGLRVNHLRVLNKCRLIKKYTQVYTYKFTDINMLKHFPSNLQITAGPQIFEKIYKSSNSSFAVSPLELQLVIYVTFNRSASSL